MYIESEFALLEANNEQLTRENKTVVATLELVEWVGAVTNDYCPWCMGWRSEGHVYNCPRQQALRPHEECSCLPDLPDGRGRGHCPVCEADSIPSSIDITTWEGE